MTWRQINEACLAGLILLLLAPLIVLIAAAIVVESGPPVFFLQTRIGRGGRPFRLIKFRKFRRDLPARQLPLTMRDDPRLTRVGRLLERSKLDELPQLWNVVRVDMAIVGPRPRISGVSRLLRERIPGGAEPRSRHCWARAGTVSERETALSARLGPSGVLPRRVVSHKSTY